MDKQYTLEIVEPDKTYHRELLDEGRFNNFLSASLEAVKRGDSIAYTKEEFMLGTQLKVTAHKFQQGEKIVGLVKYEK